MGILTQDELSDALQERMGMDGQTADEHAEYLLGFFGFRDRIIDNLLEPEDRQLFYTLQAEGLLGTRRELTDLWNGGEWRTHYWVLKPDLIHASAEEARARRSAAHDPHQDLYMGLPEDVWSRA